MCFLDTRHYLILNTGPLGNTLQISAYTSYSDKPTCDLCTAAGPVDAALIPQHRNFSLEHLQAAHEVFEHGHLVGAAARLPGYVDAVGKDDLVLPVDRVLSAEMAACILRLDLYAVWRIQVHRAKGAGRNIDAVDVIENHRVPRVGQADVVFLGGRQSLSSMP